MRLADEIDAAQERGELATAGGNRSKIPDENFAPSMADVGLDNKQAHEARKLRDAEKASPGKTKAVIADIVARGEEPTRAKIHREVTEKPAAPAKALSEPIDPERRKLAKLTPDALIDEVLGLRADLIEAKAELAKMKTERDALKAQVKDLSATDSGAVIRKLQAEADNAKNAKWREGEKALAALKQVHALKKELKTLGATEIPL
jgi:cell division protein FtsB